MTRSRAETAFGMALSRARPNTPIADKDLRKLALDVLGSGFRGAMDGAATAFDRLVEHLERLGVSGRDRQAIFDMCAEAIAAGRASDAEGEQVGGAELLVRSAATRGQPGKVENYGVAQKNERQAADRRLSRLDRLLAGVPSRRWIAGR